MFQKAVDFLREMITDHPSGHGEALAVALAGLVALWVLTRLVRRFRIASDPVVRTLTRFMKARERSDVDAMTAEVAVMKFDRSGRIDDWFTHAPVSRLATFQPNVALAGYVGKEPRQTKSGGQVGGMLSLKIRASHPARGTYDAMVFMGRRPGVPFDGKWKVLVQDFVERAGPYEGPTAIYTYKKPKLSPIGDDLAKAWKAHSKPLGGHVLYEPPGPERKPPPAAGPMQEPSPFYGGGPGKKKGE